MRIASDCGNSLSSAASTQSTTWQTRVPEPSYRVFHPYVCRHPNLIGLPAFPGSPPPIDRTCKPHYPSVTPNRLCPKIFEARTLDTPRPQTHQEMTKNACPFLFLSSSVFLFAFPIRLWQGGSMPGGMVNVCQGNSGIRRNVPP